MGGIFTLELPRKDDISFKKFGVSCWHMNDYESKAMWKLYANKGIAIESTIGQFKSSFLRESGENKIYVFPVRYEDFEKAEIEKGHRHYALSRWPEFGMCPLLKESA
jgi:hypothetical protein